MPTESPDAAARRQACHDLVDALPISALDEARSELAEIGKHWREIDKTCKGATFPAAVPPVIITGRIVNSYTAEIPPIDEE